MHCSEIIKLQFDKKNAIHCFVFYCFFRIIIFASLSLKNACLPPNFLFGFQ